MIKNYNKFLNENLNENNKLLNNIELIKNLLINVKLRFKYKYNIENATGKIEYRYNSNYKEYSIKYSNNLVIEVFLQNNKYLINIGYSLYDNELSYNDIEYSFIMSNDDFNIFKSILLNINNIQEYTVCSIDLYTKTIDEKIFVGKMNEIHNWVKENNYSIDKNNTIINTNKLERGTNLYYYIYVL